jgi:putative ABC transport system permease protein
VLLWLRWSWRDLRARFVQVAAIAAIAALGTGVYAGLSSTSNWRRASYNASYSALAVHDLDVSLAAGTFTDPARLEKAVAGIAGVREVQTRLVVPISVDASRGGRTILVAGRLVGTNLADTRPRIDKLYAVRGRTLGSDDIAANRVVIDEHFAHQYKLPSTGTVTVSGSARMTYAGQVLSPEYFTVMSSEGTMHAEASFAVLFGSLETAQRLSGHPGLVNDAVVRLADAASPAARRAMAQRVQTGLRTRLPGAAVTVTAVDDDRAYRMLYDDIGGDQRLYSIFAFLILGGAAFAAFNLIGRVVEAQRREIGIGMALGLPRWKIAVRPALVGFQVALFGAVLGIGVGLAVSRLMLTVLEGFVPLPVWKTSFQVATYTRGWAIGLALPFLATLIPVFRAVRVEPVDAIRTGPTVVRSSGLAPLLARLTSGNSIRQMPLRNVFRAPRRALFTTLAIAAAIATLVGVIGIVDSFFATIDRGESAIIGNQHDRLTVDLSGFAVRGSPQLRAITAAPGVKRAEPGLQVGGTMRSGSHHVDALIALVDYRSPMWHPGTLSGHLSPGQPGIVIAEKAAHDLHVTVGDTITVRHPLRQGLGYKLVDSRLPIQAIHDIPYRFIAFMDIRTAGIMNLDGIYNTVAVAPKTGTSLTQLQRELFAVPGVGSVQPVLSFAKSIRDMVNQVLAILRVVEGAVLLLALLIAFNSSAISVDERAREHATMFAFGVPLPTVLGNTVLESLIVGSAGTALGIGAGYGIVQYITQILLPGTLPDVSIHAAISAATIATAAVLGVVAVAIAPLFTARRMRRMNIPATLRVVE